MYSHMTFFMDLAFVLIIVLMTVIATVRGFVSEILLKGAPFLSIWAGILLYKFPLKYLEIHIPQRIWAVVISFFLVFVIVYIILMVLRVLLKKAVKNEILKGPDRFLGFVFGLAEGLAVVVLLLIIFVSQPFGPLKEIAENCLFYKVFKTLIAMPLETVNSFMNMEINRSQPQMVDLPQDAGTGAINLAAE